MLKAEQAREQLEKVRYENGEKRRLAALAKLPKKLAEIGRGVLGRDARGKALDWQARDKAERAARARLDELSIKERRALLDALFPKLGHHVDAAWELTRQLPYEVGYVRKAFRAPEDPAVTRPARLTWFGALLGELEGYEQDATWLAAWAGFLSHGYCADAAGIVLAAAINAGGREGNAVFETLCDSARGSHPTGTMGRHVTRALLVAARPEGWEFMEKMLLAAQRQEGLRQSILEAIDEAHPDAFRRMLRLILEHDLARFSSVVRALNVWFGFQWDSVSVRVVNRVLERVLQCLEDPQAQARALESDDAETVFLALWTMAFEDAATATRAAGALLTDPNVERRFIAAQLLGQLQLPAARTRLLAALDDTDLRVALCALQGCEHEEDDGDGPAWSDADMFERLERLLERIPEKKQYLEPIVWPWHVFAADRQEVTASLMRHLGKRPPTKLIRHLPGMEAWSRRELVQRLTERKKWDEQTRDTLFALVGDPSITVREAALTALAECKVSEAEAYRLEELLTRKTGDLRRGVLTLLLNQKDQAALASADRLLAWGQPLQRHAGLELLRQLAETKRVPQECRSRAEAYRDGRLQLSEEEVKYLEAILDTGLAAATLDNALGLINPEDRSKPVPPRARKVTFMTPAALACLQSLDDLIHAHREEKVVIRDDLDEDDGEAAEAGEGEGQLLGEVMWGFPVPSDDVPLEKDVQRLPMREVWEAWWAGRPRGLKDRDGLELLRADMWQSLDEDEWKEWRRERPKARPAMDTLTGGLKFKSFRYEGLLSRILDWLLRLHPPRGAVDFLLDAVEASFALVPREELARVKKPDDWYDHHWRDDESPFRKWVQIARRHEGSNPGEWTGAQRARFWRLLHWMNEPAPGVSRERPEMVETLAAFKEGAAREADVLDHLLGPRQTGWYGRGFDDLQHLSGRKLPRAYEPYPFVAGLVDRCRKRILEIELKRGDTPTAASAPALCLNSVHGLDTLLRLLKALGREPFARERYYDQSQSRASVLSHLVRVCYPVKSDTPEHFAARVKEAGVPEQRLIELAFAAPQWVRHVEHTLGWPQLSEGVWWFIAHTRQGSVEDEDGEGGGQSWEGLIRERTALTLEELGEGAVDVAWFHRTYEALGEERWQKLSEAVKYAVVGQAHKKAQALAEVLLGKTDKATLVASIRQKHLRDAVRYLGLLPLAKGKARDQDLLERYHVLQEYHRYARSLGAMSREQAVQTAVTGLANLARTAGYADPIRMEWSLEAETVADLAKGPVTVKVKDVTVSLAIDAEGQPEVKVTRGDKPLKTIPAEAKQNDRVKELTERRTEIKRQASRMRNSLEQAMCRGDSFTASELRQLCAHPVLAPRLQRLVLIGEGIAGYPVSGGKALRDHAGKVEPIKKDETLRLAHPHDLLRGKHWHLWQHDCFTAERVQPFKQVFRELYVLTDQEKKDGTISRRYAGQQVNPRQAAALWNSRGWVAAEYEGVRRTFHDVGLSVEVVFLDGTFTPAEVEGVTLEGVQFTKRGEWKPIKLTEVPPRLFSEVMRDLDLVVSVAHRGGVDPEASASTVEMRASLLKETCALLKLRNVRVKPPHVLIDGQLANYSVHLGSAVTHRQPGGALCLIPVHAQHRGRLFLPFADDDPKTAEVISKVILLARDQEIQDPGILDQLRAAP
jgi:hypothetical protein